MYVFGLNRKKGERLVGFTSNHPALRNWSSWLVLGRGSWPISCPWELAPTLAVWHRIFPDRRTNVSTAMAWMKPRFSTLRLIESFWNKSVIKSPAGAADAASADDFGPGDNLPAFWSFCSFRACVCLTLADFSFEAPPASRMAAIKLERSSDANAAAAAAVDEVAG